MFFINQGSQVVELVNAVIEAITAIASGAVGGAAKLVENALVRSLPVVIGFLASLLGISGLAKKVQNIVKKIRSRIDKAIDKVLKKAKSLFKGKKGKGNKDKKESGKITEADKKKHEKYLGEIATSLTQKNKSPKESFEEFSIRKKKTAEQLRKKYQKKLKKGINITTYYKPLAEDKKDGDLDIAFKISPNDSERVVNIDYVEEKLSDNTELKKQIDALLTKVITHDYLNKLTTATEESGLAMRPRYEKFKGKVKEFLNSFDSEYDKNPDGTIAEANEFLKKLRILETVKDILLDLATIQQAQSIYGEKGNTKLTATQPRDGQSVEQDLAARNKIFGRYSDIIWNEEVILPGRQFIAISGSFEPSKPRSVVETAAGISDRKINAKDNERAVKEKLQQAKSVASRYDDILILVPEDIPQDPYRGQTFEDRKGNQLSINVDNTAAMQDAERKFYGFLFHQIKNKLGEKLQLSEEQVQKIKAEASDEFDQDWEKQGKNWQEINRKLSKVPEENREQARNSMKRKQKEKFIEERVQVEKNSLVSKKDRFFEENREKVTGNVKMFSEMTPCDVCQTVDKLVDRWFPKITVDIEFGVEYP
jgi:hypothetical protein